MRDNNNNIVEIRINFKCHLLVIEDIISFQK